MKTEKMLLRALNATTAKVIKQKWVYSQYVGECFAADWHMHAKTMSANIYLGKTLIFGYESPEFKQALSAAEGHAQSQSEPL